MTHLFVILKDGILYEYNKYEDIPDLFDNVIKFIPEIPEGQHTNEQHDEIDKWNHRLQELMKRETK
jgi:hypothetical protein